MLAKWPHHAPLNWIWPSEKEDSVAAFFIDYFSWRKEKSRQHFTTLFRATADTLLPETPDY